MDKLIQALNILLKYENPKYPTHCEHDTLYICISPEKVSQEDLKILENLGICEDIEEDCFYSYRYGSA